MGDSGFVIGLAVGIAIGFATGGKQKLWSELAEIEKVLRIGLLPLLAILVVAGMVAWLLASS